MSGNYDFKFWGAIAGATVFKMIFSPYQSPWHSAITGATAIFSAWLFTDPVLKMSGLAPQDFRNIIAAGVALTGQGAMKWLITATPESIIKAWRGK